MREKVERLVKKCMHIISLYYVITFHYRNREGGEGQVSGDHIALHPPSVCRCLGKVPSGRGRLLPSLLDDPRNQLDGPDPDRP